MTDDQQPNTPGRRVTERGEVDVTEAPQSGPVETGDARTLPPIAPQDVAPADFEREPEGTTDAQFMRIPSPRERSNSTSEPE